MSQTSHDKIRMLLPWYVNETLTESERQEVEARLGTDLVLHRDLRQTRALANLISKAQPEQVSARQSLSKLHASIRSQRKRPPAWRRLADTISRFTWLQGAAAITVLVFSASGLWLFVPTSPATFETLTDPATTIEAAAVMRVVFRQHVSPPQAKALTEQLGGNIVAGPSAKRVYTIVLRQDTDPQLWLAQWRASPDLQFAELVAP